jgi:kanamycin kinase/aminoglycoside 3'-phosphotransferase-2
MGDSSPLTSIMGEDAPPPPSDHLLSLLAGTSLHETHEGHSGSRVFRVERNGQPVSYLKIARREGADDLQPELARLLWLSGQHDDALPVPRVQAYSENVAPDGDAVWQYLLIEAMPGVVIYDHLLGERIADVLTITAQALRRIHDIPIASCPFDMTLDVRVQLAGWHVRQGWVDADDFDDERLGLTAEAVYEQLLTSRPTSADLVFTHGDYCAPNILLDPTTLALTGLIDWGRAGIADRYQDLALHTRSIAYNFGAEWEQHFYRAYGLDEVDQERVDFYRLLDEFF